MVRRSSALGHCLWHCLWMWQWQWTRSSFFALRGEQRAGLAPIDYHNSMSDALKSMVWGGMNGSPSRECISLLRLALLMPKWDPVSVK